MQPRGVEESVEVFHVHQKKDIRGNCKEIYELWKERNPMTKMNIYRCKIAVKQQELHS
jgi:hypothetical protein